VDDIGSRAAEDLMLLEAVDLPGTRIGEARVSAVGRFWPMTDKPASSPQN
jgi:hypothetical protein